VLRKVPLERRPDSRCIRVRHCRDREREPWSLETEDRRSTLLARVSLQPAFKPYASSMLKEAVRKKESRVGDRGSHCGGVWGGGPRQRGTSGLTRPIQMLPARMQVCYRC
jgi:hypothetical protein